MSKCPYTFPHRSREAMISYLDEHESYHPMKSWNGGFCLAWNVKVYDFDEMGKSGDCGVHERFDKRWQRLIEKDDGQIFWDACRSAISYYAHGDWSPYPGGEHGYKFGVNGRSGGYLLLEEWPGPMPKGWACCRMTWDSRGEYHEWLRELSFDDLRRIYRAVRCLDHDLSRERCEAEVSYQINFLRAQWEQDKLDEEGCRARRIEAERPDLYGAVT